MQDSLSFHLDLFSGPLEFLIALIQNEEIDLTEISLKEVTAQYLNFLNNDSSLDTGADFVGSASLLIWLKSKCLLPKHEQALIMEEGDEDPEFAIIHHLIDYCRFREAAKALTDRELEQSRYYYRGIDGHTEIKKPLGIEHLSLSDFATLFQEMLAKSSSQKGVIQQEEWKVSDKIAQIKTLLQQQHKIEFYTLFDHRLSKNELIAFFLAILEMMKSGMLYILKTKTPEQIVIASREFII